jgi:hypothetical protein
MIQIAVLSGEVPVRAIDFNSNNHYAPGIHIPIEKQICADMHVDVFRSLILTTDKFEKWLWWQVEIHWPKCVDYCEQYLIPSGYTSSNEDPAPQKPSRRPAYERAARALKEIYGQPIPDSTVVPNKALYKAVNNWLTKNHLPQASDTTILRAAGRR